MIVSAVLASGLFLAITVLDLQRRSENIAKLSDDTWVRQKLESAFQGFPVVAYLGNVTNTQEKIEEYIQPNMGEIVEWKSGKHPEYFRWFAMSQREPDTEHWDPTNLSHVGFMTSDLEIYDLGLDPGFQ